MKPKFDKDRLLAEMVMDDAGEAREALLGRTLGVARRVRRGRRVRRAVLVVAALALIGAIAQRSTLLRSSAPDSGQRSTLNAQRSTLKDSGGEAAPRVDGRSYVLIETVPIGKEHVVTTMAPVMIVETIHDPTIRILNDDELLAMAPAASLLRRLGPGQVELIMGQ